MTQAKMKADGRDLSSGAIDCFRAVILDYYKEYGRTLPWRLTTDPYRVLVSEIMLQQTQVDRVTPKYEEFIARFPDFSALARATLQDVLRVWQGLGYNRRAIFLKRIAEQVMQEPAREFSQDVDRLQKLPGLGYATACSLMAFAFNAPVVFIAFGLIGLYQYLPREFWLPAGISAGVLILLGIAWARRREKAAEIACLRLSQPGQPGQRDENDTG